MRLSLVAAVLVYSMTLTDLAFGGLVEVNSSQYLRESGNPQAQYLEVTLDNAGEIRVSNVNLQDGYIELAASTDVLLNGSSLMQPFSLPTGGSAVFPLEAGTHYLEVTLRGKPGGGLKVSFYEDKPDAPIQGKGWDLLDNGTVIHKKTGLNWHRNLASPGLGKRLVPDSSPEASWQMTISQYIDNLNSGVYGVDPIHGNAGFSDWRSPTIDELVSAWDHRASSPPISDKNGDVTYSNEMDGGWVIGGIGGGMKFGDPLFVCDPNNSGYFGFPAICPPEFAVENLITNFRHPSGHDPSRRSGYFGMYMYTYDGVFNGYLSSGNVWPVRGGTSE